eukprot:151670-Alexandrium_andersonii.AAC.1
MRSASLCLLSPMVAPRSEMAESTRKRPKAPSSSVNWFGGFRLSVPGPAGQHLAMMSAHGHG